MRKPPRSLEEWLYLKLMDSIYFHRFVRKIYNRINGIKGMENIEFEQAISQSLYKPTMSHKFRAYRILFMDEIRGIIGLPRKSDKILKH